MTGGSFNALPVALSDRVPPELTDEFIAMSDHEDLSNLALVSRSWKPCAQHRLFRHISIIAGRGCARWRSSGTSVYPQMVPPTFEAAYGAFSALSHDALAQVRLIKFRGLSAEEREEATIRGAGHGEDPLLDKCIIMRFLDSLPKVRFVALNNVIWSSSCLPLNHIYTPFCPPLPRNIHLLSLSISETRHHSNVDNVLDCLDIFNVCQGLLTSRITWLEAHQQPAHPPNADVRPDITCFLIDIPGYSGVQPTLARFPSMPNMQCLEMRNCSNITYPTMVYLLRLGSHQLKTLILDTRGSSLGINQWQSMPLRALKCLREIYLNLELCQHDGNEVCAGKNILQIFTALLPRSTQHVCVTMTVVPAGVLHALVQYVQGVLDQPSVITQLNALPELASIEFKFSRMAAASLGPDHAVWEQRYRRLLNSRIRFLFSTNA